MNTLRRISAHPSAHACLLILLLFVLMTIAEQICRLTGVGEF